MSMMPTFEEFPGVPATTPSPASASTTTVSTVGGLTIATESSARTSTVSLTMPGGGSASEAMGESGSALASRFMTFKSSETRSSLATLRMLQDAGAESFAAAGRTSAVVGYSGAPEVAAEGGLLATLVAEVAHERWDVRDALKTAAYARGKAMADPHALLTDKIYAAAFGMLSPLGRSFYASGASFEGVASFRQRTYGTEGAILVATGVPDHSAFVAAAAEAFADAGAGDPTVPPSEYLGGEERVSADGYSHAHLALAFPAPSDPVAAAVLKRCIDVAGGPDVSAFSSPELIGAYGLAGTAQSTALVDSLVGALRAPTADVFETAVALAKGDALLRQDDSRALADAMTAGVAAAGSYDQGAVAAAYDAVTAQDVAAAAAEMLGSPLSVAAAGDLGAIPHHSAISGAFS